MTSLSKFKACAFKIQDELNVKQRLMYNSLHNFMGYSSKFLTFLNNIKDKRLIMQDVQMGMDEL